MTIIRWLPETAALWASVQGGPQFRPWTLANVLAAGALNGINAGNWQRGGGKSRRPPPIEPPKPRVAGRGGARADRARRRGALAQRAARAAAMHARAQRLDRPEQDGQRALPPGPPGPPQD